MQHARVLEFNEKLNEEKEAKKRKREENKAKVIESLPNIQITDGLHFRIRQRPKELKKRNKKNLRNKILRKRWMWASNAFGIRYLLCPSLNGNDVK